MYLPHTPDASKRYSTLMLEFTLYVLQYVLTPNKTLISIEGHYEAWL
jgi:hypothetical protein